MMQRRVVVQFMKRGKIYRELKKRGKTWMQYRKRKKMRYDSGSSGREGQNQEARYGRREVPEENGGGKNVRKHT